MGHPSPDEQKKFLSAQTLLLDSLRLARKMWDSGYRPDFIVALWRGGTSPGIAIHEFFRFRGKDPYHTAVKTLSYAGLLRRRRPDGTGPEEEGRGRGTSTRSDADPGVEVKGLDHVLDIINAE